MKPAPRQKMKNQKPPYIERIYVKVTTDFDERKARMLLGLDEL